MCTVCTCTHICACICAHTFFFHLHRWLTKDFRSEGRLSIGSTGHKNMYIGVGLGGSSLDAKGGIVGGAIELSKIDTYSEYTVQP